MDINTGKPPAIINNYSSIPSVVLPADGAGGIPIAVVKPEAIGKEQLQPADKDGKQLTGDEISQITDGLNKFMETINADLHFEIHDKTQRIIVQVVNKKDHSVIKEFPPHELLDTLAAISDYIGILLDKKV